MYCKNCGNQIADDAIFCSHCGTKTDAVPAAPDVRQAVEAVPAAAGPQQAVETASGIDVQKIQSTIQDGEQAEPEAPAKPFLEGMSWNVSEYPDSNVVEKTEDIDFDWGLDPDEVRQAGKPTPPRDEIPAEPVPSPAESPAISPETSPANSSDRQRVAEVFDRVVPAEEAKASISVRESLEAANKIESVGQFDTFNKKNAMFQELLDREYEKVREAGTIGMEQEEAEQVASRKFDSRTEDMTMDEFLQKEGAVKLYEPEEVSSDVLDRIEAQDRQKAQKEAEEAARIRALEEARKEAAAKKAAEDAARLEAITRRQTEEEARAQEEMRRRAAEEARARAEEEARKKEEEAARVKAEEAARAQAEEAARLKAEADLIAAQEAARIRAQQEAANAAREEAEFKAAQERRRREEEIARLKREAEEKQRARAEGSAYVEDEVRKALEQTAKMRQEEEDKIKAALAGIRGGRFSDTISSTQKAEEPAPEPVVVPTASHTPEPLHAAETAPVQSAEAVTAPVTGPVPTPVAEPETLQAMDVEPQTTDRGTVLAAREEIEAAHRHTRYNIEGMAKAREDFFADLPGGDPQAERIAETEAKRSHDDLVSPLTRTVDKEAIAAGLSSTKKLTREDMQVSAGDLLSQFASVAGTDETTVSETGQPASAAVATREFTAEPVAPAVPAEPAIPAAPVEPEIPTVPAQTVEPVLAEPAVPAALEQQVPLTAPEDPVIPAAPADPVIPTVPADPVIPEAPAAPASEISAEPPAPTVAPVPTMTGQEPVQTVVEDLVLESPADTTDDPSLRALMAEKPGLEDTMVMPEVVRIDEMTTRQIDNYRDADPEELKRLRQAAATQEARAQEEAAAAAAELDDAIERMTAPTHETAQQIAADMAARVANTPADAPSAEPIVATGEETGLTSKELRKRERAEAREARRLAKQKKKEEKQRELEDTFGDEETSAIVEEAAEEEVKSGKGRMILMIILIFLCLIFAAELLGIFIKTFASTSAAAEFIDNILNSLIHMITGESDSGAGTV